ncbi:FecR domain-containing protein [Novipirellula rosea]|uniref:FecR protein domain-containing protein n=1 Tax=Novipirellula rosea TaxID=1031540 RepID=A0ABP8NFR9_9BACT
MNDSHDELLQLLDELLNQTIDADRHSQLQDILKSDPEAREQYLEYLDLHFDLDRLHQSIGDLPPNADNLSKLVESTRGAPKEVASDPDSLELVAARARWTWWASLAVAIALCVGVALVATSRNPSESSRLVEHKEVSPQSRIENRSHVQLTQALATKFFGEATPPLGSFVPLGHEFALSSGMVELQFPAGATTIIEAPAVFVVTDDARLELASGSCSVHAPEGAKGFRVDTPLGNIIDLGTRFVVDVDQTGDTKVQVVEGEADLIAKQQTDDASPSAATPINLQCGQARQLLIGDRVDILEIPFDDAAYRDQIPDRIVRFDASRDEQGNAKELQSVTVQRGGIEHEYQVDELIGFDMIHFQGGSDANIITAEQQRDPIDTTHSKQLRSRYTDRDRHLCSGLINPGGSNTPLSVNPVFGDEADGARSTPGFAIRFQKPVINSAGPDVVFFELQVIIHPEQGDAFHVSPLQFTDGLRTHTIESYDIDLASPESKFLTPFRLYRFSETPTSLGMLNRLPHAGGTIHSVRAKVIAVGIDLSDLGYAAGAEVNGLFFQDVQDDENRIDPVFIGGLPPTP